MAVWGEGLGKLKKVKEKLKLVNFRPWRIILCFSYPCFHSSFKVIIIKTDNYIVLALVLSTFLCTLHTFLFESSLSPYDLATFIIHILQIRKLRLRKLKGLANSRTSKRWSQVLNPGSLTLVWELP